MSKTVVVWLEEPIQSKVVRGIAYATFDCEDVTYILRGEPKTMLASIRIGAAAYAEFAKSAVCEVVQFKRKKGGKHRH